MININVDIDTGDLAYEFANAMDESSIINFIMDIDAQIADSEFTKSLIESLKENLPEES